MEEREQRRLEQLVRLKTVAVQTFRELLKKEGEFGFSQWVFIAVLGLMDAEISTKASELICRIKIVTSSERDRPIEGDDVVVTMDRRTEQRPLV
jgi:hypothetical protein